MAAPELSAGTGVRLASFLMELREPWLKAYGVLWAVTVLAGALVAIAGPAGIRFTRDTLALRLTAQGNPPPHLREILALTAHNVPIAGWPVLLGLTGADRQRLSRCLADWGVLGSIVVNCAPVGAALGAYGGALIAYVPQIPLEWAGLGLGASSWLVQRRRALSASERLLCLALTTAVLLGAAVVESVAVPHR